MPLETIRGLSTRSHTKTGVSNSYVLFLLVGVLLSFSDFVSTCELELTCEDVKEIVVLQGTNHKADGVQNPST